MDININYLRESPGQLNVAEWLASLLVLICASSSPVSIRGDGWVYFTSITCTIVSFAFFLMYMVRIVDALHERVNWFLVRLSYAVIFAAFYFISMCISAAGAANAPIESKKHAIHSANTAAAVFAAVAVVSFVWDAIDQVQRQRVENTAPLATDSLAAGHAGDMRYT